MKLMSAREYLDKNPKLMDYFEDAISEEVLGEDVADLLSSSVEDNDYEELEQKLSKYDLEVTDIGALFENVLSYISEKLLGMTAGDVAVFGANWKGQ